MAKLDYDALNSMTRYMMISVFAVQPDELPADEKSRAAIAADTAAYLKKREDAGVVVRGLYDVAGFRADADFMMWTHAERVEDLQATYTGFRRTALGAATEPVWSVVALHRPAEFNKSHLPAFIAGEDPGDYICVYPFVRSLDWYLLPDDDRRRMLVEHGMGGREYPDVRANTVPVSQGETLLPSYARTLEIAQQRVLDAFSRGRGLDAVRIEVSEAPKGARLREWRLVRSYASSGELRDQVCGRSSSPESPGASYVQRIPSTTEPGA